MNNEGAGDPYSRGAKKIKEALSAYYVRYRLLYSQ